MRKFIIITLFLGWFLNVESKELKVGSFQEVLNDNSAKLFPRIDLNGDTCALVKVNASIDGLKFEGAIGEVTIEDGNYWVYLSPGARKITIKESDSETLNLLFKDISDISFVKSDITYSLYIIEEQEQMDIDRVFNPNSTLVLDTIYKLPNDINARKNEVLDANGKRCALMKVSIPIPDCQFEGNVGDVIHNINEYSVYVSTSFPYLIIKCPGLSPLEINLGEIESATSYSLKFSGYETSLIEITPQLREFMSKYDDVFLSDDTYIIAGKRGQFGVVDLYQNEVIPCLYDYIDIVRSLENQNDVRFIVSLNGKKGVLDSTGKIVVPFNYQDIQIVFNYQNRNRGMKWPHYFEVSQDEYKGVIDFNGNEIIPCTRPKESVVFYGEEDYIRINYPDGMEYYNKKGNLISKSRYMPDFVGEDIIKIEIPDLNKWKLLDWNKGNSISDILFDEVEHFKEGLAQVSIDGKWGFIDNKGNIMIDCNYSDSSEFGEGLAAVKQFGKWGYINKKGELIVPFQFDYAESFYKGYAFVKKNDKCGLIDTEGNFILDCEYQYEEMEVFEDYDSPFWRNTFIALNFIGEEPFNLIKNDEIVSIDISGNEFIPVITKNVKLPSKEFFILQNRVGKYGVIDSLNNLKIPFIYDYIGNNWNMYSPFFVVKKDDKIGLINLKGDVLVPIKYDKVDPSKFSNRLCIIEINGKKGVFDYKNGRELLPCLYSKIYFIDDFIALQEMDQFFSVLDSSGKIVSQNKYKDIEGNVVKNSKGKKGLLNHFGELVIPCIYDDIYIEKELVKVEMDGKEGFFNKNGEKITDIIFDSFDTLFYPFDPYYSKFYRNNYFVNGFAKVSKNGINGLINIKGDEIWFNN